MESDILPLTKNQRIIRAFNRLAKPGVHYAEVMPQLMKQERVTFREVRNAFWKEIQIDIGPRKKFYLGGVQKMPPEWMGRNG